MNKEDRAINAQQHTIKMSTEYFTEIENSIKTTKIYDDNNFYTAINKKYKTEIDIVNKDSVTAIIDVSKTDSVNSLAVLNFASYCYPGGGYLNGSMAQEEALCSESFLYNVLCAQSDFYDHNVMHRNNSLYENRALYSKDIYFIRNNIICKCDVLTCAAPNRTAFMSNGEAQEKVNDEKLYNRIKFILSILASEDVKTIILGAFGCGVFGQSTNRVAHIFKELLETDFDGVFEKVIFAIPVLNLFDTNLQEFQDVFLGIK